MKVSLNSIRGLNARYGCADDPAPEGVDNLLEKIGAQLGGVEEVIPVGAKYDGVVIVKVVSCGHHPNADRLHVCMIDDGGVVPDMPRNENGHIQVVCGAPNVREGLTVAWLPPGSTVPSSFDSEPFVLEARELRGVISNGMLASPKELALGDSHEGILEIDEAAAPGTLFAEKYRLKDDVVIDIENKMFTHRPDCFGWLGVAREIAGIHGRAYKTPDWFRADIHIAAADNPGLKIVVRNEIPELIPRFTVVPMSNITIGQSPVWLQVELSRVGIRPINNVVDLTNFFMMETGQPLHAYDYDKVVAQDAGADHATLVIRKPHEGEKLKLLNGKEIQPRSEAILIASATNAIGLGGVMGGADTEVDASTKNIILECASFDTYSVRRTSMAHGIFSDAVTRFTKGQSPLQNMAVLAKIVDDVLRLGGKIGGHVVDDNHLTEEVKVRNSLYPDVNVSSDFVNSRLGLNLSVDEMARLLTNVEFQVGVDGENMTVRAPFWRTDIEIAEDIVEEIGRLYGYDKLPLVLPGRTIAPVAKDKLLEIKSRIRDILAKAGANELLTYSFVHGNLFDKTGQDRAKAFELSNALSPDLQYYRLSLTPSLLDKIHANIKAGYDEFALFEIGKTHVKGEPDPFESTVPKEVNALSVVYSSKSPKAGAPYYVARKILCALMESENVGLYVTFEPLEGADLYRNPWIEQMTAPYEPARSAVLRDKQGLIWGVVGEYKAAVRKALKLPDYTAGFEIDPLLLTRSTDKTSYVPMPRFPKVTQDITLKVPAATAYREVYDTAWKSLEAVEANSLLMSLKPLDIYQSAEDEEHKQITLRLTVSSYDKTLTDTEVSALLDKIAAATRDNVGAEKI